MIRNNLSWINLNAGSSGGSGGGGVSDYNDLANRPIISMTGTSQNPLKLWNLSTGLYLLNGYVYYDTTNTRECVNLFVSITAQIQNGKYVLSAFVPSWEGHYEYIKANSTSTDYTDTQILKMLTEDDVLTLTNEVEYTPTTDYHPSTKKYVDEAMQSVMEEFAKMGVNEQDIKTLIAENRRRDIAIQALLNETADKNVTIEEDTHTISLDYSMEDGMATVNSIEGSTLVNVSKTVDEVYITKSQDRVEQSKVANTIGEQNGKLCPIIEGDTLVNVCDQKDPIAITKSYTIENSGNHIALQGEYDGKCRPVIQGNTLVNLLDNKRFYGQHMRDMSYDEATKTYSTTIDDYTFPAFVIMLNYPLDVSKTYTVIFKIKSSLDGKTFKYGLCENNGSMAWNVESSEYTLSNSYQTYIATLPKLGTDLSVLGFSFLWNLDSEFTGVVINIKDVMIFEGDLTQTPELIPTEYIEGLKSSFEDNIVTQAMVDSGEESAENLGKYKVEYKVSGKNKLKANSEYSVEIRKVITSCELKHNTNYVFSLNYTKGGNFAILLSNVYSTQINHDQLYKQVVTDGGGIELTGRNVNYKAFNSGSYKYMYITSWVYDSEGIAINNLQLEEGTVATEYEPYKSYTKTFYLNSPLLEGDTIEDVNGVATHVKRYDKVVLDGSDDEDWYYDSYYNVFIRSELPTKGGYIANTGIDVIDITWNGVSVLGINCIKHNITSKEEGIGLLQANPTAVVYKLASPIYEPISDESILCDSYANGHLDFDSAVPIEKVVFKLVDDILNNYLLPSTLYTLKFDSDNSGVIDVLYLGGRTVQNNVLVKKGVNTISFTLPNTLYNNKLHFDGIGFNASNIVVTEATDKDFDYFNGIQSTFEENLVTDENNPHYGKYRVIYRTKSSDGNASTVKSVYLNSPLLQGDKLVVVNGKLCHYHKMSMVVLDGSESWNTNVNGAYWKSFGNGKANGVLLTNTMNKKQLNWQGNFVVEPFNNLNTVDGFKQWLQANPTTVVYELETPYYEEISSNPKDTVVDFYTNGTLEVQSAVYPLSMEFTSFEEELTYLYASTVYTVQFEANGNAIANITLGGTTVANQEITHGLNKIQVTTPSTLVDNKLIIDGSGDCKISKVVVTNSTEEFEYFEGMKSAFEDKQNEDGTYTVEIVVYNAPIRLNKDKE